LKVVKSVDDRVTDEAKLERYSRLSAYIKKAGFNLAKRVKYSSEKPQWLNGLKEWNNYLGQRLKDLKGQIASGKLTFQDAAKKHSESPTRDQGGEVGLIGFRGKLPAPVCRAAFSLKVNEISEPVISPFGVHLVQVTEIVPGDLSLEDVRPQIFDRLSEQLWTDTIARERKSAKIERR